MTPTSSQLPLLLLAKGVAVVELLLLSRDLTSAEIYPVKQTKCSLNRKIPHGPVVDGVADVLLDAQSALAGPVLCWGLVDAGQHLGRLVVPVVDALGLG